MGAYLVLHPRRQVTVLIFRFITQVPGFVAVGLWFGFQIISSLQALGGSGDNVATHFSNRDNSHQSSLGLYRTAETYIGDNGYSLRMDGLDPGFNDNARSRAIVMHGAWYVAPELAARQGRLGRSHGCPALRQQVARVVIDELKDRQLLFAYADDAQWLQHARSFACDGRSARQILAAARTRPVLGGGNAVATAAP